LGLDEVINNKIRELGFTEKDYSLGDYPTFFVNE
jgi:hypothetical protein